MLMLLLLLSRVLPPLNFSIMCKIGLLGLIGSSSQIMGYTGINYSSPTLASAISNLTPAFTFILAIVFRMEKVSSRKTSSQAKVLGTILSIGGAFIVTLYKGPPIIIVSPSPSILLDQRLHSSDSNNWVIGGLFLTAEYILIPLWYIVQAQIMKVYPAELTVVFFYNLCVSFIAAIVGLITERDSSAWRVRPDIALASILCSGLFGSCMNNTVHTWALRVKGPVYVAMFKPLSIAIAIAMGVMFLGDTLHLGRYIYIYIYKSLNELYPLVIGATVISLGFYTVMWGKAKEEMGEEYEVGKVPLLQGYKNEQREKEREMLRVGYFNRVVVPFTALVAMECTTVGLNTLYKAAALRGMSYHVFMVYDYAVAALLLLPAPFFTLRSRVVPPLTLSILCKIGLIGLIGCASQIVGLKGINYSSPTLASAISNLTPAFTFILAIIFRMEKFTFKKQSSQAKVLGTIVSIGGAFVVTLYKGPPITLVSSSPSIPLDQPLHSSNSNNWLTAGLLLTAQYILVPLWYIVLAQIMEEYPAELTVVFIYNICVCFLAAIVGLIAERDSIAWRLRPNIALASILCSQCSNPLSIAVAVAMGVMFLGDTLHLGSVVGATIISLGFYTLMWGKAKEDMTKDYKVDHGLDSPPASKVPLFQSHKNELA
ncbi:hypothetical protein JRO89_XS01G0243700 [Xanthoceras sorbifolium]|uniref:EamA domain-containing protein n=1 Tax=Xanthoceras sorbifolium TaxID=99658 RepID=A0ABQ8IM21_9ROSI|nr:hypothetical protein JRO89_XS01G0243700 [Xanthoceras sorbifolium]